MFRLFLPYIQRIYLIVIQINTKWILGLGF